MRKSSGSDTDVTLTVGARRFGGVFIDDFGFGLQRSGSTQGQFIDLNPDPIGEKIDLKFTALSPNQFGYN